MMTKSTQPVILFFKSGAIANNPGLVQRVITDRRGHQARRWVRASEDAPKGRRRGAHSPRPGQTTRAPGEEGSASYGAHNVEPGDTLAFRSGALQGHGQVQSVGKDGATIADESGKPHQVLWSDVSGRKGAGERKEQGQPGAQAAAEPTTPAQGKGQDAPAAPDAQGDEEKALQALEATINEAVQAAGMQEFFAAESQGLPKKVASKFTSWEELEAAAPAAQAELEAMLKKAGDALGGESVRFDTYDYSKPGIIYGVGPVKTKESSTRKVTGKYEGDWSKLGDLVRGSVGFDSVEEMKAGIEKLKAAGLKLATMAENKFATPTPEGYRDMNLNILMSNGVVGELQLHLKPMLDAKNEGHSYYEESRVLRQEIKDASPGAAEPGAAYQAPGDKQARLNVLVQKQRKLYGNAMAKALDKADAMVKAFRGKMILLFRKS